MNTQEADIRRDEVAKCCAVKIDTVLDRLVRDRPDNVTVTAANDMVMKTCAALRAVIRSERLAKIQ